jgi:hypothetical protein
MYPDPTREHRHVNRDVEIYLLTASYCRAAKIVMRILQTPCKCVTNEKILFIDNLRFCFSN